MTIFSKVGGLISLDASRKLKKNWPVLCIGREARHLAHSRIVCRTTTSCFLMFFSFPLLSFVISYEKSRKITEVLLLP
jgi:hypothetical protein